MTHQNLKSILLLFLGMAIGAGTTYGILRIHQSRAQAYLDIYTTSWDTYFTTQTISELRQGNLDKAESLLQTRLNAQLQSIGITLENNDRYKSDYLQTIEAIREHRAKFPYSSKNNKVNTDVEKVLALPNKLNK